MAVVLNSLNSWRVEETTPTINDIEYEFNATKKTATVVANRSAYRDDIVIPETVEYNGTMYSVTTIGKWAFNGCSDLTSVTIPNSVTIIDNNAFYGCTELTSIVVESGNTRYDSREGSNAIIETVTNTLIASCKNTVIPNSVTTIGDFAFSGCKGLTSINIPNSVTTIGDYAFNGCTNLETILIGKGVATIAYRAFYNCTGLESIYLMGDVPPTVNYYDFTDTQYENLVLYVPEGTLATYQAADEWKEFKNIQEFDPHRH